MSKVPSGFISGRFDLPYSPGPVKVAGNNCGEMNSGEVIQAGRNGSCDIFKLMNSPLLRSLFDEEERRPLTISELNARVKGALETGFSSVWIEGEISDFFDATSGHWYFGLHDADSQVKAACYKAANWRIRFKPFNGLQVRVRGKLTVYEPRGEYQILVESLEPVGEGAIKIAFEQIKEKLQKEGLFDPVFKRKLPYFPKRVGVVTSPNGAAFHDILNVLSRRTKSVHIVLIPARVQGETAPEELRRAVLLANGFSKNAAAADKIDVLIVTRGGGGAEDLSAFNEEHLARAIFASEIPVISAVGHETDFTIADFVADVRAPTPSAAAEIVAEREDNIETVLKQQTDYLCRNIGHKLMGFKSDLRELALSAVFVEFPQRIRDWSYEIEDIEKRIADSVAEHLRTSNSRFEHLARRLSPMTLSSNVGKKQLRLAILIEKSNSAIRNALAAREEMLKIGMASLDALSPLAVLGRGFSITQVEDGEILRDSKQVTVSEQVKIRLAKGKIKATVTEVD